MRKTKITLEMTTMDMLIAMAEGNPDGLRVCMDLLKQGDQIDPDNALGGLGVILDLDSLGIYGSRIWMLYKDVCGQDYAKTIACLRAWQLGIIDEKTINHAVDNRGAGLDLADVIAKVKQRLPAFRIDVGAPVAAPALSAMPATS